MTTARPVMPTVLKSYRSYSIHAVGYLCWRCSAGLRVGRGSLFGMASVTRLEMCAGWVRILASQPRRLTRHRICRRGVRVGPAKRQPERTHGLEGLTIAKIRSPGSGPGPGTPQRAVACIDVGQQEACCGILAGLPVDKTRRCAAGVNCLAGGSKRTGPCALATVVV